MCKNFFRKISGIFKQCTRRLLGLPFGLQFHFNVIYSGFMTDRGYERISRLRSTRYSGTFKNGNDLYQGKFSIVGRVTNPVSLYTVYLKMVPKRTHEHV